MSKALAAAGADVVEVDLEGTTGWVRGEDTKALASAKPPAGVRLLPGFDPYVNDLPRRVDALLPVDRHEHVYRTAGWISPVVLVDGRGAGTWEIGKGAKAGIEIQPFGRLRGGARKEIEAEADRFAAFLDRPLPVTFSRPRG